MFKPRIFLITFVALVLVVSQDAFAGMAGAITLREVAKLRLQSLSFFIMVLLVSAVVLFLWQQNVVPHFVWAWNGFGLAALGVLPVAAMPLAVRWNRHQ